MNEVCRPIKRIDHPREAGWRLLGQPTFLSKDTMGGEGVVDDVDDPLLCLMIGVGDQINEFFMLNVKTGARAFY
jgi:hypothetical protein